MMVKIKGFWQQNTLEAQVGLAKTERGRKALSLWAQQKTKQHKQRRKWPEELQSNIMETAQGEEVRSSAKKW